MKLKLPTERDTYEFGVQLAGILTAGDVVILHGPLGAGKTALTRGIGSGLAVIGHVSSPTFVISRFHPADPAQGGTVGLTHVDAYRLQESAEWDGLDLESELDESVVVVEWGVGFAENLAASHLKISITVCEVSGSRVMELSAGDQLWNVRLLQLEPAISKWRIRA